MGVSYFGRSGIHNFAGTSVTFTWPGGLVLNDILMAAFAFEGVGSSSGPWVQNSGGASGWTRAFYQDPAGTGSGLEVWYATWSTGTTTTFNFFTSRTGIARGPVFRCGSGSDLPVETTASQAVTGDNPSCPSVTTTSVGATVVGFGAHTLSSPGWGAAPSPYVKEIDNARLGTFGNVELMVCWANQSVPGDSGTIDFTATATSASAEGATGSIVVQCASVHRAGQIYRRIGV